MRVAVSAEPSTLDYDDGGVDRRHAASPPSRTARRRRWLTRWPYILFLVPSLVLVGGLMLYPIYSGIVISFHRSSTFSAAGAPFVGWHNYQLFFDNPSFGSLILHSYIRAIGGVVPSFLLGLGAALILNRRRRMGRGLQIATLLPFVMSAPVSIFMWLLLISPQYGIPQALGIQTGSLMVNTTTVWPTLLFINAWASYPLYTIVILAALQRIPQELHEAAAADGAGPLRRFWHITLPGIGVVALAVCTFHFMASFQDIALVFIATGGGPLNATQTVASLAYQTVFGAGFNMGYGAALSMISLALMFVTVAVAAGVGWLLWRGYHRSKVWRLAAIGRRAAAAPPSTARLLVRGFRPRRHLPDRWRRLIETAGACLVALFAIFPILFVVAQAFDGSPPGSGTVRLWPDQPTLRNFWTVVSDPDLYSSQSISKPPLAENLLNSIIVTASVTVIVLVLGSLAGYALARWTGWASRSISVGYLIVQFVPAVILVFPLYSLLAKIGLLNSLTGLSLATAALSLPTAIIFFRVFFHALPREWEEAAAIDGAGPLRTFLRIITPNTRSAFGAMGAFTLIGTWNEFLIATTLVSDSSRRTFPPALQQFAATAFQYADKDLTPGVQAVYLLIPILSSALLLSLTLRHFTAAVQGGGTKG